MHESDVIQMIHEIFPDRPDVTPLGIGDDCARLARPGTLITTDASVENVHFDLSYVSYEDAAYRCLASNLSDIAAMGALASAWTLALGLSPDLPPPQLRRAVEAFRTCLDDHESDAWLIGGDVVRSERSFFSITMWGDCSKGQDAWLPVTRAGARIGDMLVVLGTPGRACAGFECLKNGMASHDEVKAAFLRPRALTRLAPILAQKGLVRAMMDTSDGIFADLPRLLAQSHVGARIELEAFDGMKDDELDDAARALHKTSAYFRIYGGEDYGILAAIAPANLEAVNKWGEVEGGAVSGVGTICEAQKLVWARDSCAVSLEDCSFRHFSN